MQCLQESYLSEFTASQFVLLVSSVFAFFWNENRLKTPEDSSVFKV